jgi:predicted DNA-binding protein (UPF0251 family)
MTQKDKNIMSIKEVRKYEEIKRAIEGKITQSEAAINLGISERNVRRMVKKVRLNGAAGLIHGLRGSTSCKRITEEKKEQIIDLCADKYKGFSLTLTQEKLLEIDKLMINRESLREILMSVGIWEQVRKGKKHRMWRKRKEYYGEMQQLDGSIHDWLEGRGPKMVLMSFIDDATGRVYAIFFDYEGTVPAMVLMKKYIKKYGMPRKVYLDRHSTYKSQREATIEEQLKGEEPMSQFERALKELGIEVIHAYSPQAKGRIERSFRTHQDRLIKEMRLAKINTKEEANKFLREYYLPKHNKKFCVLPAKDEDVHMELRKEQDLNKVLAINTERTVRNDYTIAHDGNLYQLKTRYGIKGRKVMVSEKLNGKMSVDYKGERIKFSKIDLQLRKEELCKAKSEKVVRIARKTSHKPAKSHPWVTGDNWQVAL